MKKTQILAVLIVLASCSNHQQSNMEEFKAEKVSKTASFVVNGNIQTVFPLFGAFEERKWEKGWNPVLIYPSTEVIEEGTTFKTHGHGNEPEFLWRVSKYEPQKNLIQYLVSTDNRYWTITVKCEPRPKELTFAEVTYSFIGLNHLGNELNKKALEKMYRHNLKDWEKALNYYMESGESL